MYTYRTSSTDILHPMSKKLSTCFLGLCLMAIALSPVSLQAQAEVIDEVIANVGGELVLLSEVQEQKSLMEAQQGTLPEQASCFILDNILAQKLLVNQAKLDSVIVTDIEVDVQLDARFENILAYMNNDYQQFEDYYGQTVNEVRAQFREGLKDQLLAERIRGGVMAEIKVTPSEVIAFFERIPSDSLPYFNSEVEVREIVYQPQVNQEEREKAKEALELIREMIVVDGADFAEMATKYSEDFASARIGGDLGWTTRGKFVPEFEAAAYNLGDMEISEIVETEFGYHVIQMLERRGNSIHTRHILIMPKITEDDIQAAAQKTDTIYQLIKTDSISFSYAVKEYSTEDFQSFNNDGRMINPATGNTFFEIGDLDPDVYFAIDTLDIGEVSQPFLFRAPDGTTYFRIVELLSRTDPHVANLQQDYSKIQAAAIEEKKSRYLQEWLEEKVQSTFIRVDDRFASCPNLAFWLKQDSKP
jgi:peptidyl-prolyl cis-trans isomerase SurA